MGHAALALITVQPMLTVSPRRNQLIMSSAIIALVIRDMLEMDSNVNLIPPNITDRVMLGNIAVTIMQHAQ